MHQSARVPLVSWLLVSILCAGERLACQSGSSPAGLAPFEGNSSAPLFGGSMRHQQIDNTQRGRARTIAGLGFRRDALGGGPTAGARSLRLRVRLDEVGLELLRPGFEATLLAPTEVFAAQLVQLPDWSAARSGTDFDVLVPFVTPFSYTGQRALLIDFEFDQNSSRDATLADFDVVPAAISDPTFYGSGCTPQSGPAFGPLALTVLIENSGPGMPNHGLRIVSRLERAIPISPSFLFLDFVDANLTVPGLCGTLHVVPGPLTIYLGDTNGQGSIDYEWRAFSPGSSFGGATFIAQAAQFDAASTWPLPIVLSNPVANVVPLDPPTVHECAWHTVELQGPAVFAEAHWQWGGGFVIELR